MFGSGFHSSRGSSVVWGTLLAGTAGAFLFTVLSRLATGKLYGFLILCGVLAGILLRIGVVRWWARRNVAKAASLQQDLHALRQEDFELRYEMAKRDGTLDRWKDKAD